MPTLQKIEKIIRVELPTTAKLPADDPNKAWVDFDIAPQTVDELLKVEGDETVGQMTATSIMNRTKGWNYSDPSGQPLPITMANFALLDIIDYNYLRGLIGSEDPELSAAEKKV